MITNSTDEEDTDPDLEQQDVDVQDEYRYDQTMIFDDEEDSQDTDPNLEQREVTFRDVQHSEITEDSIFEDKNRLANHIRNHKVSYWSLFGLIMGFEGWIAANALLIWGFRVGACSKEYSLALYHFNEIALGVGYGICKTEKTQIPYFITTCILTNLMSIMILLELVGHLLDIKLRYGEKKAVIFHFICIVTFILFFFLFIVIDMTISGRRSWADSSYYVFATAFTTGEKSPSGFKMSSDMTQSTGVLAERIWNIACVQMMSFGYAYCAGVLACWIWSTFIKQKSLAHLEVKQNLLELKKLAEANALRSQTIQLSDIDVM